MTADPYFAPVWAKEFPIGQQVEIVLRDIWTNSGSMRTLTGAIAGIDDRGVVLNDVGYERIVFVPWTGVSTLEKANHDG